MSGVHTTCCSLLWTGSESKKFINKNRYKSKENPDPDTTVIQHLSFLLYLLHLDTLLLSYNHPSTAHTTQPNTPHPNLSRDSPTTNSALASCCRDGTVNDKMVFPGAVLSPRTPLFQQDTPLACDNNNNNNNNTLLLLQRICLMLAKSLKV